MYTPSILVYKYININNDFFKYRIKHQLIFITASFWFLFVICFWNNIFDEILIYSISFIYCSRNR